MASPLLSVEDLSFGFRGKVVGRGFTFQMVEREVLAVLGPNGAGKSTLFRTLLKLLPPQAGRICLQGQPLAQFSPAALARTLAYIPQAHACYFPYAALDMVMMGRTAHLGLFAQPSAKDRDHARAALAALDIAALATRPFNQLSGGEQQLVLIARALATEATLFIMDEPTANLDYGNHLRVLDHIARLRELGRAVLLSTHHPEHARDCADRVLLIQDGQLAAIGAAKEVVTPQALAGLYGIDPARLSPHLFR